MAPLTSRVDANPACGRVTFPMPPRPTHTATVCPVGPGALDGAVNLADAERNELRGAMSTLPAQLVLLVTPKPVGEAGFGFDLGRVPGEPEEIGRSRTPSPRGEGTAGGGARKGGRDWVQNQPSKDGGRCRVGGRDGTP